MTSYKLSILSATNGANQARFCNFINLCLTNRFRTMHSQRMTEPLCRPGNVSLGGVTGDEQHCATDEFCQTQSPQLKAAAEVLVKRMADRQFVTEFADFVRRNDAGVMAGIEAIGKCGSRTDAAGLFGITPAQFARTHRRLRLLGYSFVRGAPCRRSESHTRHDGHDKRVPRMRLA